MDTPETPFFFGDEGRRLFGILHAPAATVRGGFVFCHPFAEEKLWTHRVFVAFARELAKRGYSVLRFDMSGHGDSDGEFAKADLDVYRTDVSRAVDELAGQLPEGAPLGLLGLRLGGALAARVAEDDRRVSKLVLWDPVVDGAKYSQEILLANLAMQMAAYGKVTVDRKELVERMEVGELVNIDGYDVSYPMFKQITEINLHQQTGRFRGDCLIAQIDRAQRPSRKEYRALAEQYAKSHLTHAIEQPFWKEIKEFYGRAPRLFAVTEEWLDRVTEGDAGTPEAAGVR